MCAFLDLSRRLFLDADPVDVGGSRAECQDPVAEDSSFYSGGIVMFAEPNPLRYLSAVDSCPHQRCSAVIHSEK